MKRISLILFLLFTPFICVQAQEKDSATVDNISFLPAYSTDFTSHSLDLSLSTLNPKKSKFLFATGWLLQGLKYNSAFDEFTTSPQFDFRSFEPASFSSYSDHFQKNYLIMNQAKTSIWKDQ